MTTFSERRRCLIPPLTQFLARPFEELDRTIDRWLSTWSREPQILPYRGYGTHRGIWVAGRVMEEGGITSVREQDSGWDNLRNMIRRFRSRPIVGSRLRIRIGDASTSVVTDDRGFYEVLLRPDDIHPTFEGWQPVEITCLDNGGEHAPITLGRAMVASPDAELGVISDIDDTILHTYATDRLRMLKVVLFENAHSRLPFPGVCAFYRALHDGCGRAPNPFFYVSSSAWNIYDVLHDFMALHGLPDGPILLRDLRLHPRSLFAASRHEHKLERIRDVLDTWSDLPFVLIGDSGQRDAELYHRIVQEYPGRIQAIYLREVHSSLNRHSAIAAIASDVAQMGSELLLVQDTYAAAEHAAARGWIDRGRLAEIAAEKKHDEPHGLLQEVIGR